MSKIAEPTFGEKLLRSFANDKPANIYDLLGADLETLVALPLEQQTRLAKFATQITNINFQRFSRRVLPNSTAGKEAKRLCRAWESVTLEAKVAQLQKVKRWQDLGVQNLSFDTWAKQFLKSVQQLPSEDLLAAVSKIAELGSDHQIRTQVSFKRRKLQDSSD